MDKKGSKFEISNFPEVKDQGDQDLCYAFASSTLLSHHRCITNNISCDDPSAQVSPLSLSGRSGKYGSRVIGAGVNTENILGFVLDEGFGVVSEKCAPFDVLFKKWTDAKNHTQISPQGGLNRLNELYSKYAKQDPARCAMEAGDLFGKNFNDVLRAAQAATSEEFIYRTLVPSHCLSASKLIKVPKYKVHLYPDTKEHDWTGAGIMSQAADIVRTGTPVAIAFCSDEQVSDVACEKAHIAVIKGIKEVCSNRRCKTMFKLHNSYGKQWQKKFKGGWVDAADLSQRAAIHAKGGPPAKALTWIASPEVSFLFRRKPTVATPVRSQQKSTSSGFKCVNADGSVEYLGHDRGGSCEPM